MDNSDLKYIKKHYGENFMHLCRTMFPTILEEEGLLSEIISSTFVPTRSLCDDLKDKEEDFLTFKRVVLNRYGALTKKVNKNFKSTGVSPEELLSEAGYILYPECQTEADIQKFRKYWETDEELCTFYMGERLNTCRVWFALKKNIDEIKREDFTDPKRQDEYGTSAISIQFTRMNGQLSIKNRYNHIVKNPDATFGNNLDNIVLGLTDAFVNKYNINIDDNFKDTDALTNYVYFEGKYYRYNLEIDGTYFCENNIVINSHKLKKYDKEKFILVENYLIDLQNNEIKNLNKENDFDYPMWFEDYRTNSFGQLVNQIGNIDKILLEKNDAKQKVIRIKLLDTNCEDVLITVNDKNQMIGYENNNVITVDNYFLNQNRHLQSIKMKKVERVGDSFLSKHNNVTEVDLPNLKLVGDDFLNNAENLTEISLPNVKFVGGYFLAFAKNLAKIDMPQLEKVGSMFLLNNSELTEISFPNLKTINEMFIDENKKIKVVNLPKVTRIGWGFLYKNQEATTINMPQVESVGDLFLQDNIMLKELNLPNIKVIGNDFLKSCRTLNEINIPNVERIGDLFLRANRDLRKLDLPNVKKVGDYFLYFNNHLSELNLPNVEKIGYYFMSHNLKFCDYPCRVMEKNGEILTF